jgi:leader peptidase (prepilin peptidase) / N-methyltransferase
MLSIYSLVLGFSFILGACIGSFLNVCIYRIPAGESIVSPPSRCPRCGAGIRWYQNIPIFSWIALGGKCASCKAGISVRYPLVEALTGGLFTLVFFYFGIGWPTLVFWVFMAMLVVITFIDLDHQIIPDVISLPGIVIGFFGSFLLPWISWTDSLYGILLGGGSLFLIATGYELLTKKEGMGGGDVKLLAMLGAFLGWKAVLPIIFVSSLLGTIVGVPLMLIKGADSKLAIPFGPFLASAAVIWLFWGGDWCPGISGFFGELTVFDQDS